MAVGPTFTPGPSSRSSAHASSADLAAADPTAAHVKASDPTAASVTADVPTAAPRRRPADRTADEQDPVSRARPASRVRWDRLRKRLPLDVLVSWLVARLIVGATLAVTRYVVTTLHDRHETATLLPHTGLLGWDAGWYENIAGHGYHGAGPSSLRFFPLFPLLGRLGAALPGLSGHAGAVLVVVANLAALGFVIALARLARREGYDEATVRRVVWLAALAPPAFVLVMGYAEALFGLLAVLVLLGARTRRWELATAAGFLAGLCRPVGLLLVAAVAIEASRGLRQASGRDRARRVGATVAPVLGALAYLLWVQDAYGDWFRPFRLQRSAALHGASSNPARVLWDAAEGTFHGHVGTGLHVPWLIGSAILLVVMARRLPASYTAWAALTLVAVLTGSNLDSSERYLYSVFPFLIVAADLARRRAVWWLVLTGSAVLMSLYALLAFLEIYVP